MCNFPFCRCRRLYRGRLRLFGPVTAGAGVLHAGIAFSYFGIVTVPDNPPVGSLAVNTKYLGTCTVFATTEIKKALRA
jgi:hypothetical protein